jgi:hypothetical protein
MPTGVNEITIVLLPKKEEPELLKDFRPISLCNVIYKVVSKCLVNGLRPLLQDLIAPMQCAFVPRRMITDNTLIAFECLHAIEQGNSRCKEFGALKLDLTKAYDRVDWEYLEGVLKRLGFHRKWAQWIMACVTTVRYSIRFNNVPLEPFTPSHGVCQGDPLSPYLFLFVANGLSQLLQKEVRQQNLQELHICRRAPSISHLLFADDTLMFLKASEGQAEVINNVIKAFERGTCQLVNLAKCSMMFGSSCSSHDRSRVLEILSVSNTTVEEKYLGLPTPEGRMNKDKFKTTEERLVKRCSSWAEKHMSMGVKEVLIKSVA